MQSGEMSSSAAASSSAQNSRGRKISPTAPRPKGWRGYVSNMRQLAADASLLQPDNHLFHRVSPRSCPPPCPRATPAIQETLAPAATTPPRNAPPESATLSRTSQATRSLCASLLPRSAKSHERKPQKNPSPAPEDTTCSRSPRCTLAVSPSSPQHPHLSRHAWAPRSAHSPRPLGIASGSPRPLYSRRP
jgi:hypothetical protein